MDNNKTFMFMIVLASTFIIMNLYFYYARPKVQQQNVDVTNDMMSGVKAIYDASNLSTHDISKDKDRFEIINKKDYQANLSYENSKILVEFTQYDAAIRRAVIKNQNKNEKADVNLITADSNKCAMQLKLGSWANGKTISELTNGDDFFNVDVSNDVFTFTCQLHDKLENRVYTIVKTYTLVADENIFKLDVTVSNDQKDVNKFDNTDVAYSIGWGPSLNQNDFKFDKRYDHFAYFNGKKLIRVDNSSKLLRQSYIKDYAVKTKETKDSYLARNDRYFTVLMMPDNQNYNYFFDYRKSKDNEFYTGFERCTSNVSVVKSSYIVYMGPQLKKTLKKYNDYINEEKGITIVDSKFSKSVRLILWGIGDLMGLFLNCLYFCVRNYGLAIILLTIIIKLLLAPLTNKSMKSQSKMSELQPKVKELQEKYKDKPEILNRETMLLYKKAGVNPFGGCLPLLLQMPILIAMYRLLDRMVELQGASFLWINDLSRPDCVLQFPFTIPLVNINGLNVLPIIMILTQVWSTISMPGAKDNKQTRMMMWLMPVMFFFMFYNVSSGLVLYWTVMNILGIIQQEYMNRSMKKEAMAQANNKPITFVKRGKKKK